MFAELAQKLVGAHRRLVQLDALVAVAFGDLFAPHVDPSPHALRAGITAPDAAGIHSDKEQAKRRHDQNARQQDEVLWPECRTEDEEFTFWQVPPDGLVAAPVQPYRTEVQQEQAGTAEHPQVAEQASEGTGVDFLPRGIQVDAFVRVLGRRGNVMYRNLVAHQLHPTAVEKCRGQYVPTTVRKGVAMAQ